MDKEALKEELRTYLELLKIITAFLIAIGGGTATLFTNLDTGIKAMLFFLGLIFEGFLIMTFISFLIRINSLLRRLRG